jgi:hypothetical protein
MIDLNLRGGLNFQGGGGSEFLEGGEEHYEESEGLVWP